MYEITTIMKFHLQIYLPINTINKNFVVKLLLVIIYFLLIFCRLENNINNIYIYLYEYLDKSFVSRVKTHEQGRSITFIYIYFLFSLRINIKVPVSQSQNE